ncbi:hypothetical protein [Archangium sp.]|uniref:hypothetical protein n=1 Tax=Archangium sp. TaxID=1872627 RepID=UPI002D399EBC|nr:hypothetical protein [Archangium sp.]HYO56500.1 hypothetical protein [Archangium sp.]
MTPNPNETPTAPAAAAKPSLKERFKTLLAECAVLAFIVYLGTFVVCMAGFGTLLHLGFEVKGTAGNAGVLAGAYAATKLATPFRIMATLALTPPLERLLRRIPAVHRRLTDLNKSIVERMHNR